MGGLPARCRVPGAGYHVVGTAGIGAISSESAGLILWGDETEGTLHTHSLPRLRENWVPERASG